MNELILSIDQGTTSSRAIIFNHQGQAISQAQEEFEQHYPNNGWVEHDPEDLWQTSLKSARLALAQAPNETINAIGITNQRETTLIWDKASGLPIHKALVWQDRRTKDYCDQLREAGHEYDIKEKTGLLLDPYFSATKIKWLLDNIEGARERAIAGKLAFGTVDTFLLWRLSKGRVHATDATNASRTMLFNIHTLEWDEDLLALFDIPASILPVVKNSADDYGLCDASYFGKAIPITAVIGDQQAALVGHNCFSPGEAKTTYGTGCFMVANTGTNVLRSDHKLLTTIAYQLNNQTTYALEGSIFIAGAAIGWLRDGLQIIADAKDSEALARQVTQPNDVIMVPALTGLGAPYWDPDARGAIFGLSRDTGIKEIACAALESVCYQTKDLQKAMEHDGQRPNLIRVDGGLARNDWAMQFLADILGAAVDRPQSVETTALGAAYLAGLQIGLFSSLEHITSLRTSDKLFTPKLEKSVRDRYYRRWQNAVAKVITH